MSGQTVTVTLSEFLLARIAEDEAAVRGRSDFGRPHWAKCNYLGPEHLGGGGECDCGLAARAQVDLDSKRQIIELHPTYRGPRLIQVMRQERGYACERCHATSSISETSVIEALGDCETLRLLALPYADHPDYDPEWRP